METQHTAYRQIMSVNGIPSIPKYWSVFEIDEITKTGLMWNKYGIYPLFGVIRLRVIRNPTHSKSSN